MEDRRIQFAVPDKCHKGAFHHRSEFCGHGKAHRPAGLAFGGDHLLKAAASVSCRSGRVTADQILL